ncbi:hypothetical protein V6N12_076251 [Hibiscus sabdariffa]|uniref:Uncharacterized protein n=1 Tax=Hibiscus sabdariffa TaxID=183260 RepID=A0ABR1ZDX0_9ROSI
MSSAALQANVLPIHTTRASQILALSDHALVLAIRNLLELEWKQWSVMFVKKLMELQIAWLGYAMELRLEQLLLLNPCGNCCSPAEGGVL